MAHPMAATTPEVRGASSRLATKDNVAGRRATLAALASAALFPALAQAASTTSSGAPLEGILLGDGRWKAVDRSLSSPTTSDSSALFSANFCTYACRFLIQYDASVSAWWNELEASLQLLDSDQAQAKLGRAFGSLAKSMERAFDGSSSTELYDQFAKSYGQQPDAPRQIALLFSLLPAHRQPISRLQSYYDNESRRVSTKADAAQNVVSKKFTNDPTSAASATTTVLFGNSLTRLLPAVFRITPRPDGSFSVQPAAVALYETGMGPEQDPNSSHAPLAATAFGPMASAPLTRDAPVYALGTYALFAVAGATGCAVTHTIVIPLDGTFVCMFLLLSVFFYSLRLPSFLVPATVLKTRAQTDPAIVKATKESMSLLDAGLKIVEAEGVGGLFLGAQATIAGYCWYGATVYPSYTFVKRFLAHQLCPVDFAVAHGNEIALLAGACAAVMASLGLTPLEAARIRVVADPAVYKSLGLTGTLGVIAKEDPSLGWTNLYAGLPSLLTRQVIFGSIKFLAFERSCELLFALWPVLRDTTWSTLAVSLVAGGLSGVISSVVSQPADCVLTYVSKEGGNLSVLDAIQQMVAESGPSSLFRGLGSRCVWAGSIIAGQFLLYDIFRTSFGVSANDLSQIYEVVLSGTS